MLSLNISFSRRFLEILFSFCYPPRNDKWSSRVFKRNTIYLSMVITLDLVRASECQICSNNLHHTWAVLRYKNVISFKFINKFVQKCRYYKRHYNFSDQSVLGDNDYGTFFLLTEQPWVKVKPDFYCKKCSLIYWSSLAKSSV